MKALKLSINKQPDNLTCGPTSLHALYNYWGDNIPLSKVINEIQQFEKGGGTLSVILGKHALSRDYEATIFTYNLAIFDPSWFNLNKELLKEKLLKQMTIKRDDEKFLIACGAYVDFLDQGGVLRFADLSSRLILYYLKKDIPILAGVSATWLYHSKRELPHNCEYDDMEGVPAGHFVVLYGLDEVTSQVLIADPYIPNPITDQHYYMVPKNRLITALLLGDSTYDGNLLIIRKKDRR